MKDEEEKETRRDEEMAKSNKELFLPRGLAQPTRFLAILRIAATKVLAVRVLVIAGVGGRWCHTLTQSTADAALRATLIAPIRGKLCTVAERIIAGI